MILMNHSFINLCNNSTYLNTTSVGYQAIEEFRGYINLELPSCEPVEDRDNRQGVAFVVEHSPATQPTGYGRLPPEYALAPVMGRAQDQSMHLVEELPLALGRFRERRRLALVFRGSPVICHFHENDILLIRIGHENQVLAKIEQ